MKNWITYFETPWIMGAIAGLLSGALSAACILIVVSPASAHQIITSLSHLAWPLIVLLIVFWLRKELRALIGRVRKGKFPGGAFEFDSQAPPASQVIPPTNSAAPAAPPTRVTTARQQARGEMENRILKTLWTKQVNRFPKYEGVWTFRLQSGAEEFFAFREAAGKLMADSLVTETDTGQIALTREGFEFCKKHYNEFPDDLPEWWPNETLDPEKLKIALGQ